MKPKKFADRLQPGCARLAQPTQLDGEDIDLLPQNFGLHLTEIGMALGINNAALYSKKSSSDKLSSSVSILLRLYAAFPQYLPRITPPLPEELVDLVQQADPDFPGYSLGPLLGLETNSAYRILREGFDKSAQTTKALAWLIGQILKNNPSDFAVIKEAVELEAAGCSIKPVEQVWKTGGWKATKARLAETGQLREKKPVKGNAAGRSKDSAPATAKKPVRRSAQSTDS